MAGRGMGAATRGGGAVMQGTSNKVLSSPLKKSKAPTMDKGSDAINQHKRMAMGEKVMAKGGAVKKMTKGR